jgi:uncharacterized protein (DUF1800 family)
MYRSSIGITLITILAACAEQGEPQQDEATAAVTRVAASRLLDQATFGARPHSGAAAPAIDTVEHVIARGISGAVNDQLLEPAGAFARTPSHSGVCDAPFDPSFDLGAQFFVHAIRARDQLRLRTMFALHQILVVSENGINENRSTCNSERRDAMMRYLNTLRTGAFGNYRDLLEAITLEPAMGTYLDMANNVAFDASGARITPNENFARELLQLFTLGTSLLAEDGTVIVDADGKPRPAYNEGRVQALARTLTGWTYAGAGCPAMGGKRPATYTASMIPCDVNHDDRMAQLFNYAGAVNGGITTAGAGARRHLDEALDNIFHHPNLPPFVVKQLIQHLVTSNPSRAYVRRIVQVFKDDGTTAHRRGNLRAVVRAILLDAEARNATPAPSAGRLRAPAELIARVLRSFGTRLDGALEPGRFLNARSGEMGQSVPRPPSVFSYYAPNNPLPDFPNLVGPELGLLDTGTIAVRANFMHSLLHSGSFAANGINFDLADIPDTAPEILDWIDDNWMHGVMSAELRTTLTAALADPLVTNADRRKQLALYLAALSPEFQIQR